MDEKQESGILSTQGEKMIRQKNDKAKIVETSNEGVREKDASDTRSAAEARTYIGTRGACQRTGRYEAKTHREHVYVAWATTRIPTAVGATTIVGVLDVNGERFT